MPKNWEKSVFRCRPPKTDFIFLFYTLKKHIIIEKRHPFSDVLLMDLYQFNFNSFRFSLKSS